jgi:hypothetical protein
VRGAGRFVRDAIRIMYIMELPEMAALADHHACVCEVAELI